MSTSQLTENDLTRTSSSSDPDWDVFELNSNCDDPDNGGGGGLPGRNTDGKYLLIQNSVGSNPVRGFKVWDFWRVLVGS